MNSLVVMVGIKDANNNVQLLGTGFALPKKGYFVSKHPTPILAV